MSNNIYKYLFYRLYKWNLKTWGEKDDPVNNAFLGTAAIIYFNFFFIMELIDIIVHKLELKFTILTNNDGFYFPLISGLVIFLFTYSWLYPNKRYKTIIKYFDENDNKIKLNILVLWLFVISSIFLVFIGMVLSEYLIPN